MILLPAGAMILFILSWLSIRRSDRIAPIDFFVIFMIMQYGPHILLTSGELALSSRAGETAIESFRIALAFAYVALSFGLVIGWAIMGSVNLPEVNTALTSSYLMRRAFLFTAVLVPAYCLLFLYADGVGFPRLTENLRFIVGSSMHSYVEIRRTLFADTPYEELAARLRFSVTAALFASIVIIAYAGKVSTLLYVPVLATLFIICAMQLSKFPTIYYLALAGLAILFYRKADRVNPLTGRFVATFSGVGVIFFFLLLSLYQFQYSDALDRGLVADEDIYALLWYRPFFAVGDALHLWFEVFPDRVGFLGFAGVGLFGPLLGFDTVDPTLLVPQTIFGADLTTNQTGFIGSGYAAFGHSGIIIYSTLVGVLVWIVSEFPFRFLQRPIRSAALAFLCLNMYFLTTRQFHTALQSGGIVTGPIIFLLISRALSLQAHMKVRLLKAKP